MAMIYQYGWNMWRTKRIKMEISFRVSERKVLFNFPERFDVFCYSLSLVSRCCPVLTRILFFFHPTNTDRQQMRGRTVGITQPNHLNPLNQKMWNGKITDAIYCHKFSQVFFSSVLCLQWYFTRSAAALRNIFSLQFLFSSIFAVNGKFVLQRKQ